MAFKFINETRTVLVASGGVPGDVGDNISLSGSHNWWKSTFADDDEIALVVTDGQKIEVLSVKGGTQRMTNFIIAQRGLDGTERLGSLVGAACKPALTAVALNSLAADNTPPFILRDDIIISRYIRNNSITRNKISTNAVGRSQLEDGEVVERKLATDSVGERALKNRAVSTQHLDDGAVTEDKLEANLLNSTIVVKANRDGDNLTGIAGWRGVLGVAEADSSARVPALGGRSTGKSANTAMVGAELDISTSVLETTLTDLRTEITDQLAETVADVTAAALRGRLIGYEEVLVSDSNKVIMEGAFSAYVEFSGGGGGGGAYSTSNGRVGEATTITTNNGDIHRALGGAGGRNGDLSSTPIPVLVDSLGSPGGTGNRAHSAGNAIRDGDNGQSGQLVVQIFEATLFPLTLVVGSYGVGGNVGLSGNGGNGAPGFIRFWYYS